MQRSKLFLTPPSPPCHCPRFAQLASSMLHRDPGGSLVGIRHFVSPAIGGWSNVIFNWCDFLVLLLSIAVVYTNYTMCILDKMHSYQFWSYLVVKRLHIIVHVVRAMISVQKCVRLGRDLKRRLQTAVSQNKRRFIDPENKLDLDLTYICDRCSFCLLPSLPICLPTDRPTNLPTTIQVSQTRSHVPGFTNQVTRTNLCIMSRERSLRYWKDWFGTWRTRVTRALLLSLCVFVWLCVCTRACVHVCATHAHLLIHFSFDATR